MAKQSLAFLKQTSTVSVFQKAAERIGVVGLYLFSFSAWVSKDLANSGLYLVLLACLLDVQRFWSTIRRSPLAWAVGAIAAYIVSSAVVAVLSDPDSANVHYDATKRLVYLLGFVFVAWWMGGSQQRILIALSLALAGFVLGCLANFEWSSSSSIPWWKVRNGFGFGEIPFGQYAAMAGLGLVLMAPRMWRAVSTGPWRWFALAAWLILFILSLQGVVISQSRAVWLSLLLLIALIVLLNWQYIRTQERRRVLVLGALVLSLTITQGYLNRDTLGYRISLEADVYKHLLAGRFDQIKAIDERGDVRSVGVRVHMLAFGLEHWQENMLFGHGPGATPILIQEKGDAALRPSSDLHNGYVEILVRLGLIGAGLLLICLWLTFEAGWRAYQKKRLDRDLFVLLTGAVALHLLVVFTRFGLHSFERYYWLLFGGALATFALHRSTEDRRGNTFGS